MFQWGLAPNATCECGAEEQTADHVILRCPIYRAPNGLRGLADLDDCSVTWLTSVCPDILTGGPPGPGVVKGIDPRPQVRVPENSCPYDEEEHVI